MQGERAIAALSRNGQQCDEKKKVLADVGSASTKVLPVEGLSVVVVSTFLLQRKNGTKCALLKKRCRGAEIFFFRSFRGVDGEGISVWLAYDIAFFATLLASESCS